MSSVARPLRIVKLLVATGAAGLRLPDNVQTSRRQQSYGARAGLADAVRYQ